MSANGHHVRVEGQGAARHLCADGADSHQPHRLAGQAPERGDVPVLGRRVEPGFREGLLEGQHDGEHPFGDGDRSRSTRAGEWPSAQGVERKAVHAGTEHVRPHDGGDEQLPDGLRVVEQHDEHLCIRRDGRAAFTHDCPFSLREQRLQAARQPFAERSGVHRDGSPRPAGSSGVGRRFLRARPSTPRADAPCRVVRQVRRGLRRLDEPSRRAHGEDLDEGEPRAGRLGLERPAQRPMGPGQLAGRVHRAAGHVGGPVELRHEVGEQDRAGRERPGRGLRGWSWCAARGRSSRSCAHRSRRRRRC